jgi:hypothetical protein
MTNSNLFRDDGAKIAMAFAQTPPATISSGFAKETNDNREDRYRCDQPNPHFADARLAPRFTEQLLDPCAYSAK